MPPKKNLADLKAREAELAARFTEKRKRAEDQAAQGPDLHRLKKGPKDPPVTKAVEAVAQAMPEKSIPEGIHLQDVRGKGLYIGDRKSVV